MAAMCAYVLVAEDEPRQAELIGRFLARENHTFQLVDDGRKALDEIRGRRPDLLVLDLMLPGVDGWDVCRAVRAEDAELPVLVISARAEAPSRPCASSSSALNKTLVSRPITGAAPSRRWPRRDPPPSARAWR